MVLDCSRVVRAPERLAIMAERAYSDHCGLDNYHRVLGLPCMNTGVKESMASSPNHYLRTTAKVHPQNSKMYY